MNTKIEKTFLLEFQAQTDRPETMQYLAKEESLNGKVYTSFTSKDWNNESAIPDFIFRGGGIFIDKDINQSIDYFILKFKEKWPDWTIGITQKIPLFPPHQYQVEIIE